MTVLFKNLRSANSSHAPAWCGLPAAAMLLLVLSGCATGRGALREPQVVARHGAWTWFNDERAAFVGPNLFVGYVDTSGHSAVTVVPVEGEARKHTTRLSTFTERDDHNNPAFVALPDGRVMAAYARHHVEPFWYRRFGQVSGDSIRWSPESRTADLGSKATYSNLFRLSGEGGMLYDFYRGTNFNPTLMTSDDNGETWSAPQHFILSGSGGTRPYFKYTSNGTGRIDVLYTQGHPRDVDNDVLHVYYEDGSLRRSDGTPIQPLPGSNGAGPMPVGAGTRIYDAETAGRAWVWDLEYDAAGAPVAVYIATRDSTTGNDLRYRYARWDAGTGRWIEREIAYAGTHLYDGENHYAGGITLDPSDPSVVYTSSDVHPETGAPTAHYEIYRGITTDGGASWKWIPLTPGAAEDQIRPFVPRSNGNHHAVLWLRGRYTAYTDFDTDVVGLLD